MADTFVKIASVTVGSGGAALIEFTSIPSTYTDLCMKFSTRGLNSYDVIQTSIYFNNDNTSAIYTQRDLEGYNGGTYSSSTSVRGNFILQYSQAALSTANTFGNGEMYIPNYAGSTNKSVSWETVAENNSTSGYMLATTAGLFASTNAINQISLATNGVGNWAQYSTATLYGILKA
jgi:hypothetical protein